MPQASFGKNALLILSTESSEAARTVMNQIEQLGGHIVHVYLPRILIGDIPAEIEPQVRALANVHTLYRSRIDLADVQALGPEAIRAIRGWNRGFAASFRALKAGRSSEGKSWGDPNYAPEGPVQPPKGLGGEEEADSGPFPDRPAPADDTSAYLIGTVAKSPSTSTRRRCPTFPRIPGAMPPWPDWATPPVGVAWKSSSATAAPPWAPTGRSPSL